VFIPGEDLFNHHWDVPVPGAPEMEGYPNRDAVPYAEIYGIPTAQTVFRGTLRYPGWCETLIKIVNLGLMKLEEKDWTGLSYKQFVGQLIGYEGKDVRGAAAQYLDLDPGSFVLDRLEWLGLFSDDPLPLAYGAPLDILTARMLEKMPYEEGERDMLVMHHQFDAQYADRAEAITSTMIDYGIPGGDSSMSRTVGLPAAIATRMILQGQINRKGVVVPMSPDIYEPILDELEKMDIHLEEVARPI
jgi:saccharopine dehydrogenase-like NADP-dependent oxidoreductase